MVPGLWKHTDDALRHSNLQISTATATLRSEPLIDGLNMALVSVLWLCRAVASRDSTKSLEHQYQMRCQEKV